MSLAPPPLRTWPEMPIPWQHWFQMLWRRTGGHDEPVSSLGGTLAPAALVRASAIIEQGELRRLQGVPSAWNMEEPEMELPYLIPGPSGMLHGITLEVNLGAVAAWRGTFSINDGAITATKKVLVWQAPGPYTGKGTRADEAEMVRIACIAESLAGSARVSWETWPISTSQGLAFTTRTITANQALSVAILPTRRINKVAGNVKFTYTILQ